MVNVGKWSFIVGVIIAIISGFWAVPAVTLVMVILGLIVGLLNVAKEEVTGYLIASIALLMVGTTGFAVIDTLTGVAGGWFESVLTNFTAFVAASALIVAIRGIAALGTPGGESK